MKSPDAAAFLREVMRRVGANNPTELSHALGGSWVKPASVRKLYKWHAGDAAPNFAATVVLLRAAGMLTEGEAAASVPRRAATPDDRLAGLEALVDRQGKATTRTLKGLEAQLEQIRDLLEPPAQAATEDQ